MRARHGDSDLDYIQVTATVNNEPAQINTEKEFGYNRNCNVDYEK